MSYGTVQAEKMTTESGYSLGAGNASSFKNRIINGAMVIDQRNAGAEVNPAVSGTYYLDRWSVSSGAASKFKIGQNAGSVTPPTEFRKYLGCTSLSAYTVGASETFQVRQVIEGNNIDDLGWGTANAKTVTVSFWVYSSLTGTFGGAIRNATTYNYSYPFSYTISAANTWEYKTITIAGPTAGTWGTGTSAGLELGFSLGAGSTFSGTAGAWTGSNLVSATGATSVVGTNGATFYITGVQLEVGTVATSFDFRSYGTELQLCQRYYWKNIPGASSVNLTLGICATNQLRSTVWYPTIMRAAPTFSMSSLVGDDEQASVYTLSIASTGAGTQTARLSFTATGAVSGRPAVVQTNSTTSFLDASAEL